MKSARLFPFRTDFVFARPKCTKIVFLACRGPFGPFGSANCTLATSGSVLITRKQNAEFFFCQGTRFFNPAQVLKRGRLNCKKQSQCGFFKLTFASCRQGPKCNLFLDLHLGLSSPKHAFQRTRHFRTQTQTERKRKRLGTPRLGKRRPAGKNQKHPPRF